MAYLTRGVLLRSAKGAPASVEVIGRIPALRMDSGPQRCEIGTGEVIARTYWCEAGVSRAILRAPFSLTPTSSWYEVDVELVSVSRSGAIELRTTSPFRPGIPC